MADEIANIRSMTEIQVITWYYVIDIHDPNEIWYSQLKLEEYSFEPFN